MIHTFCVINQQVLTSERLCVQYYNMASFPVWLQIQYGRILMFLDRIQLFVEQLYFTLFK